MKLLVVELGFGLRIDLVSIFYLSLVVGIVSITLTRSHLTKTIRHKMIDLPFMIGELINCPYCVAHWFAAIFALLISDTILEWFLVSAGIVAVAALFMGIVQRLWFMQESELENLRDLLRETAKRLK